MDKIRVQIIKSSLPTYWYANEIGKIYTVRNKTFGDYYMIVDDHKSYINTEDAVCVDHYLPDDLFEIDHKSFINTEDAVCVDHYLPDDLFEI